MVPTALPRLDGVVSRLESGAQVADVGCGAGLALIEMAKAYPKTEFHGYETSVHALGRAQENSAQAGITNVSFHDSEVEPLPADGSFDFICTFDCLHDMTRPDLAAMAIRSAIKQSGTWFIADVDGAARFEENLEHPMEPRGLRGVVFLVLVIRPVGGGRGWTRNVWSAGAENEGAGRGRRLHAVSTCRLAKSNQRLPRSSGVATGSDPG